VGNSAYSVKEMKFIEIKLQPKAQGKMASSILNPITTPSLGASWHDRQSLYTVRWFAFEDEWPWNVSRELMSENHDSTSLM